MNLRLLKGRGGAHVDGLGVLWSDPLTWGGSVPTTNDAVTIPLGATVYIDEDTASLGAVEVLGTLRNYGNTDFVFTAASIVVDGGMLRVGESSASRYTGQARFVLTGAEVNRATRYIAGIIATSGTGNGTLKRLFASTGAVVETITVTFSSSSAFTVSGSVSGSLGSGTVGTLFNNKVRFIATAGGTAWASGATVSINMSGNSGAGFQRGDTNSGVPRSLQVMNGGSWYFFGNPPAITRTKANDHINISDTSIVVAEAVSWNAGDKLVIGPTDFTDTTSGVCEVVTVASTVSGATTVPLSGAVARYKWGKLQYVTDTGMSLTAGTLTNDGSLSSGIAMDSSKWDLIPKILDQRAPIINLTRNIIIESIEDSAWTNDGFGVHIMIMDLDSRVNVDGVQIRRGGQGGVIGRYPIHFHMLSYNMPDGMTLPSDGTFLGATTHGNHYIKNSSIDVSDNRAVVIHGTHGVLIQNVVAYDVQGHAFFLEDGAEEENSLIDNVIFEAQTPLNTKDLQIHDRANSAGGAGGSSGYWLSNPNNIVTGNWAFACQLGFWNAFAGTAVYGLAEDVAIEPRTRPVLEHANNIAGCNVIRGFMTERPPTDNFGSVSNDMFYYGDIGENPRFTFTGNIGYKNINGAYLNRVLAPGQYNGWTVADNGLCDFTGQAGHDVFLQNILFVGVSLNNGNSAETRADNNRHGAFTSYDEGLVVRNAIAVNYPYRAPPAENRNAYGGQAPALQGGGFVRMGEYLFPIWHFTQYTGWKLIGSSPGYMVSPPHFDGNGSLQATEKFTLGICNDVNGLFTGTAGRHVIYNDAFYTTDATDLQSWSHAEAKHTSSQYFAINSIGAISGIYTANVFTAKQPFYVDRQNSGGSVVGSWNVPDSRSDWVGLSHLKHCAVMRDGIYKIGWNGELPSGSPTYAIFAIQSMHESADTITLGVAWNNSITVGTIYLRWELTNDPTSLTSGDLSGTAGSPPLPYAIKFNNTSMTSRADVIADTTGLKYWQDTTNNIVWMKLKGGLIYDEQDVLSPSGNLDPNRNMMLCITSGSEP